MTAADYRAELRRLRQADQDLKFLIKRLPGLKTIQELERIAYLVEDLSPEDAEFLRRLTKRLEEMRARFYGPRKGYKRYAEPA